MSALPIIDISALRGDDLRARRRAADQMGEAAREVGFFYVCGHGVDVTLIERAYAASYARKLVMG